MTTARHERNSALELLRIISMFAIVLGHFTRHGGFKFPIDSLAFNRLWLQFIQFGNYGNDIFIMLTGYFLVKSSGVKIHKIFNLWLRIFFYSAGIFAIFLAFGLVKFSQDLLLRSLLPTIRNQYWFASKYLLLYIIHGWLNRFLAIITKLGYIVILLAIIIYCNFFIDTSNTIKFICLYSIGGYVRLHADNLGSKKFIWLGLGLVMLHYLGVIFLDIFAIEFEHDEMMRPLIILASLCFVIGFKHLNIKHNELINLSASAVFGVYLIHDNKLVSPFLWEKVFNNSAFQESNYLVIYSLFAAGLVYISCTVIELARSKIFKTLSHSKLS
ncbi:MAG: acyltransferase family protein [Synergistaceae bacterium]|nr:acyltransferase family protein [Synergistaceae bacterium]